MKKTSAGVVKVKILITRKGLFEKRIISSNFQSIIADRFSLLVVRDEPR